MQSTRKINPAIATIIVVVLVGIVTAAVVVVKNQSDSSNEANVTQTDNVQTTEAPVASNSSSTGVYKDGVYTETGTYATPGGQESIVVTLTVSGDRITTATVTGSATSGEAEEYQKRFINGFKSRVVGRDMDEVSLSRVAGASLTSNGFNTALEQIKSDAKA